VGVKKKREENWTLHEGCTKMTSAEKKGKEKYMESISEVSLYGMSITGDEPSLQ